MAHEVFISYASVDKTVAEAVCNVLEQNGIHCWMAPRDVLLGESYAGAIIKAIHQTRLFVLILSVSANESPHIERELESALGKGLPTLPFRIHDVELSESLQYFLRTKQWMDAFDPPLEKHLTRLTAAVKKWLRGGDLQGLVSDLQPIEAAKSREEEARHIVTQTISVSQINAGKGRDGLVYRQASLTVEQDPPAPFFSRLPWHLIRNHVRDLNVAVAEVTRLALNQQPMGASDIEGISSALSHHVLPKQGFVGMIPEGVHPQLDIVPDAAADIPWELLEDNYGACPNAGCSKSGVPQCSAAALPSCCRECGTPLQRQRDKLAFIYHVTFLTRGSGAASQNGERFLIIGDPTGELCKEQHDPKKAGVDHFRELKKTIEGHGYHVELIENTAATLDRVRAAIADQELAGIYYFGPDSSASHGTEDLLALADGHLRASEIAALRPSAPLVFLNLCARRDGRFPGFQRRIDGIAQAFAADIAGKVVISPTWPMAPIPAAQSALDFFRHASFTAPLAEALCTARGDSLRRYNAGQPDVGWLAYRYIGDPNRRLPAKQSARIDWSHDESAGRPLCRVFDDKARMDTDIFSFAIDDVLLRAAKRRNAQGRKQVSVTDLLAGMVRKGELTRYVLRRHGVDPDETYEALNAQREPGPDVVAPRASESAPDKEVDDGSPEDVLRALLARWIVRDEAQFSPSLVELLINADENSQRNAGGTTDVPICEQDVLESLLTTEEWTATAQFGIPSVPAIQGTLREIQATGEIDKNGSVSLRRLDPPAQRIVGVAHLLAQQRGSPQITHRLLLAAFLIDADGIAARICRSVGIDPRRLYAQLVAVTPDAPSRSFPLSLEACERTLLPTINAVRRALGSNEQISESDFFKAFCKQADPAFKSMLQNSLFGVDLDRLATLPPGPPRTPERSPTPAPAQSPTQAGLPSNERRASPPAGQIAGVHLADFADDARAVLSVAAQLAREQGWNAIRSPHLFAALLGDGSGPAARALEHTAVSVNQLRAMVLGLVPLGQCSGEALAAESLSPNTHAVLARAVGLATSRRRTQATDLDLLEAFFSDGGGVVGELLLSAGLSINIPSDIVKRAPDSIN